MENMTEYRLAWILLEVCTRCAQNRISNKLISDENETPMHSAQ